MDKRTELKIFKNSKFGSVRVIKIDNQEWLVGKDVVSSLGYKVDSTHSYTDYIRKYCEEEDTLKMNNRDLGLFGMTDAGRKGEVLVNESGMFSLTLDSPLPNAKEFRRWVTKEVLPSIRQHGAYMTEDTLEKALTSPDFLIKLATNLKEEQEARRKAELKIEQDKPKVIFADAVSASDTSILIGDLAKLLKQNGVDTGAKRLFNWLREKGYLIKRQGADYNSPTQKAMELGLFEVKETCITHGDGHTSVNKTTKVTGRGQQYFINKFLTKA